MSGSFLGYTQNLPFLGSFPYFFAEKDTNYHVDPGNIRHTQKTDDYAVENPTQSEGFC